MITKQRIPWTVVAAATILALSAGVPRADAPGVEILSPAHYAPPLPRVAVRFTVDEGELLYETVEVLVDDATVVFEPENDGGDNDGDGLVDEPGEAVWRELTGTEALMVAWLPYRVRTDDPATAENEGYHTIRAGAYNGLREWGETEASFLVVEQLWSLDAYCFPNPFTPEESSTQVAFSLTTSAKVTIEVRDFEGNRLATVCKDEWRDAGIHRDPCDRWWGRDSDTDRRVAAGVYYITVKAEGGGQLRSDIVKVGVLPKG